MVPEPMHPEGSGRQLSVSLFHGGIEAREQGLRVLLELGGASMAYYVGLARVLSVHTEEAGGRSVASRAGFVKVR